MAVLRTETTRPGVDKPTWTPSAWRDYPADQQPDWDDPVELEAALDELRTLPPLILPREARVLQQELAAAGRGEGFVLQAGDCAEDFGQFSAETIAERVRLLLRLALIISYAVGTPVVRVGRLAGQFAKPRSSATEDRDGEVLPAFRGHAVNDVAFDRAARRPDPRRLLRAYDHALARLNLVRAAVAREVAEDQAWSEILKIDDVESPRCEQAVEAVERGFRLVEAFGIEPQMATAVRDSELYTGHEALLLPFEEALTRRDEETGEWYCCSGHFPWVGERTRRVDGAHVAFLSGVANPIGVKLGPETTPECALELCAVLDPDRRPGRLSFITRMGKSTIEEKLPPIVEAVRRAGWEVVWICDPMHGNTWTTAEGVKTRAVRDVVAETRAFFEIHKDSGTNPGGIHLELTHEDVAECVDTPADDTQLDQDRYTTLCDPRLNGQQSLEVALELIDIAEPRRGRKKGGAEE
jgi:3-deoxy-7-phosphoheptulonate synthase